MNAFILVSAIVLAGVMWIGHIIRKSDEEDILDERLRNPEREDNENLRIK